MNDAPAALFAYAMPSLGADMDEGAVIEWLVGVGDTVERGQVVARVETEKSDIDIEIWQDGVVEEIVVSPHRTVPVGATLMRLSGARVEDSNPEVSGEDSNRTLAAELVPDVESAVPAVPEGHREPGVAKPNAARGVVRSTPLARRLAGEQGIELDDVLGSGPGGAIRSNDLTAEAAPRPMSPSTVTNTGTRTASQRSARMRSMIASRMTRSNSEIPHYRLQRDIDLGALVEYLSAMNGTRPIAQRIVPAAALIRAVALAAHRHPELNGTWSDEQFHPGSSVNVSVAISLRGGGLVTPTIRDANTKSLDEVMVLLREFTTAARSGTMRSEWTIHDSSITVTNLGERGADLVHGLISPPEVALVGFGRIIERPAVVHGAIVARPLVTATLGADHRATDGATGSRFLATLAHALEEPEQL